MGRSGDVVGDGSTDGGKQLSVSELFKNLTVKQEINYGEQAPDSDVSVIKVAKEVLGHVKTGADVTNIVLPASVLDPVSSLEKGMKSMQRGEILPRIADKSKTKEERFFEVIKWFFSGLPKEKFGKKVSRRCPLPDSCFQYL